MSKDQVQESSGLIEKREEVQNRLEKARETYFRKLQQDQSETAIINYATSFISAADEAARKPYVTFIPYSEMVQFLTAAKKQKLPEEFINHRDYKYKGADHLKDLIDTCMEHMDRSDYTTQQKSDILNIWSDILTKNNANYLDRRVSTRIETVVDTLIKPEASQPAITTNAIKELDALRKHEKLIKPDLQNKIADDRSKEQLKQALRELSRAYSALKVYHKDSSTVNVKHWTTFTQAVNQVNTEANRLSAYYPTAMKNIVDQTNTLKSMITEAQKPDKFEKFSAKVQLFLGECKVFLRLSTEETQQALKEKLGQLSSSRYSKFNAADKNTVHSTISNLKPTSLDEPESEPQPPSNFSKP